ncbi:gamma-butyrobetaine dioxygenase-like [Drosophila miranda]|uniref:gamma-butyrobetaine dioxygenase-like n=1 Tax=Drosophila miranda TaxID=7229 RepID=UPI00143F7FDF|nr:gamma-butyrobetaine dioxygenase-like [Drosophila miranda]
MGSASAGGEQSVRVQQHSVDVDQEILYITWSDGHASQYPLGRYVRINHSIPQRDSHFTVPLEQVRPWYEAMPLFVRLAHEQACSFKTTPGDVLTFNNLRLVHGHTGYDDTDRNVRHIVGAFIDWDIVYSRLRVLRNSKSNS